MTELGKRYRVVRLEDGALVEDAFVLRVRKDPVGWLAAWYYAALTYNRELGSALRQWLLQQTPQEHTLGSEGQTNSRALETVRSIVASEARDFGTGV